MKDRQRLSKGEINFKTKELSVLISDLSNEAFTSSSRVLKEKLVGRGDMIRDGTLALFVLVNQFN